MDEKFLKPYDPNSTEERVYKLWQESGFFNPDICIEKGITDHDKEYFSIILPPPNVTGTLHTGHALMLAIEDIMVRFNRMKGKRVLWIPGTDHAAIATQTVVEKKLAKEKLRRQDLGREEFLKKVDEFAEESKKTITGQIKKMGASVDWSREAYTLDQKREKAVREAFKRMYDEGLIYRGHRIVNWDPKSQTTISDDEVDHVERKGALYTFKYSKELPFSIATTRPETKLGDTAVAVNPNDKRYKKLIGSEYEFDFAGQKVKIKVVADSAIDPEFGTGAVGVTAAHSLLDWEIAKRHDLEMVQVIDEFGKMTAGFDGVMGKKTNEARQIIVEWLKKEGLFEKEEEIVQNVGVAQRSGEVIEPLPKLQWFVDVNKKIKIRGDKTLKELMLDAVRIDGVEIIPKRFEKIYFNWIENLRDWNISRQIWFGHRIPVWYKEDKIYCATEAPREEGWEQDPDTLDTWFSSGLWTFSTLGWPEDTLDLKNYHPTTILETGTDLIFFWVARMILMSQFLLGEIPFRNVYMHGMILDKHGKKMSKSRPETAIDPLISIERFGADALRMAMIVGVGPGQPTTLSDDKIKAYGKFANKIWNASRFVLENAKDADPNSPLTVDDQKHIDELNEFSKNITKEMTEYKMYLVAEKLYHYFWHTFADKIIEECKDRINNGTKEETDSAKRTLREILTTSLKLLHPFTPFVTEEIWQSLPREWKDRDLLIISTWPENE